MKNRIVVVGFMQMTTRCRRTGNDNMNARVRRRDFLRAGGIAGLAGLLGGMSATAAIEAPRRAAKRPAAPSGKVLALLDRIRAAYLTVPEAEGRLLNLLLKVARARSVLEVGTAYGYTTVWLALALEETGGRLTTIEIKPDRFELARRHVAEAGLSSRVRGHLGDAHQVLTTLRGPFDLVYLDADKGWQEDYFNKLFPKKLLPGGLFVAHGAILLAEKMKNYLDLVRNHPELETVLVSAVPEDGFAVSYRRRAAG